MNGMICMKHWRDNFNLDTSAALVVSHYGMTAS